MYICNGKYYIFYVCYVYFVLSLFYNQINENVSVCFFAGDKSSLSHHLSSSFNPSGETQTAFKPVAKR